MAAIRGPRIQVGTTAWVGEERASALQFAQSEVEEFSYSARNELEWLNEHMVGIFDENDINFAEAFKTPGKLRGKTPRTLRSVGPGQAREPLSDVFAATPNGSNQTHNRGQLTKLENRVITQSGLGSKVETRQPAQSTQDSGYYGSQDVDVNFSSTIFQVQESQRIAEHDLLHSPLRRASDSLAKNASIVSPDKAFRTARQELSTRVLVEGTSGSMTTVRDTKAYRNHLPTSSPQLASLSSSSPFDIKRTEKQAATETGRANQAASPFDIRSPSEGSSPIRQLVRKSSLNFASLPAREPLTAGKSIGCRTSRTSHLDLNRSSYYHRTTDSKKLTNLVKASISDKEDGQEDEKGTDEDKREQEVSKSVPVAVSHTQTYTQRLQDHINKLGKSSTVRIPQSKSVPDTQAPQNTQLPRSKTVSGPMTASPSRKESIQQTMQTTPGAFPEEVEDEEDDWIEPPSAVPQQMEPRPGLPKSYTADVMEGIHNRETIGQPAFAAVDNLVKDSLESSALIDAPIISTDGKAKNSSIKSLQNAHPLTKTMSTSNQSLATFPEAGSIRPPESPSRVFRDSPLKQVKNKLSSILKSSRGLLASSAAISAEGKSSILSPSLTRLGYLNPQSTESLASGPRLDVYGRAGDGNGSPSRALTRHITPSELAKEEKRQEKEDRIMTEQLMKLDKAREKEREKARVFSKEQERVAAMENKIAVQKQIELLDQPKATPKVTRSSPRKAKAAEDEVQQIDKDTDMIDAPVLMPPPSVQRPTGTGHTLRAKETKRPIKPSKDNTARLKQVPTVIRVNTGSQHSQYHPSNRQSTNQPESSAPSHGQPQLISKASKASLQPKPSVQSLKTAPASKSKVSDSMSKRREQEEREAQRKREAKADADRKRLEIQEEQRRQDQQRRIESDRLKHREQEQIEERKNAQRQAAIEKAKQTRAPPPAVRSQMNGPPDISTQTNSAVVMNSQPSWPSSRTGPISQKSTEESSKAAISKSAGTAKSGSKRAVPGDGAEEGQDWRPVTRGGPVHQTKDGKRRRTSERNDVEPEAGNQHIKGPPVRPSAAFKKEVPSKSIFQNGYSTAPQGATRDLFKATVASQYGNQVKTAHPLDMAQISKGTIPFAPNANSAGAAYKTPARIGAFAGAKSGTKSIPRSSPQYQHGESIELPEIQTDDEDEEDEAQGMAVAPWADSPDLRRALVRQETMDPSQIFGPPAPLNMEEVFNKSKERWHKFRARTSSANWSGLDRLTEDDIRKDLAARDKLRREGGWSYEMSKDMV